MLPFYERYFGIGFKLPKIDMVAVPDFGFSAMENWGETEEHRQTPSYTSDFLCGSGYSPEKKTLLTVNYKYFDRFGFALLHPENGSI